MVLLTRWTSYEHFDRSRSVLIPESHVQSGRRNIL
jgi:hypothetical protein